MNPMIKKKSNYRFSKKSSWLILLTYITCAIGTSSCTKKTSTAGIFIGGIAVEQESIEKKLFCITCLEITHQTSEANDTSSVCCVSGPLVLVVNSTAKVLENPFIRKGSPSDVMWICKDGSCVKAGNVYLITEDSQVILLGGLPPDCVELQLKKKPSDRTLGRIFAGLALDYYKEKIDHYCKKNNMGIGLKDAKMGVKK